METKFVLNVEGINLPAETVKDISEALNNTLMQKIAALDLANKGSKTAPNATATQGLILSHLPNGGMILKLQSAALTSVITEMGRATNVPNAIGYSLQTL